MSGLSRKRLSNVEEWNADMWHREFFSTCSLPKEDSENYAVIFAQNGMQWDMLPLLTKELLKEMRITKVGHILAILRSAQRLSSEEQRSEISHTPKPTVQSKVVNLKSVDNLKDSRTRKPNEVGGIKRDMTGVKRSLPDEAPTLSVKMPNKLKSIVSLQDKGPSKIRTIGREESAEVTSSTEKKKSIFDRLGTVNGPGVSTPIPSSGILKKGPSGPTKGPLKFPKKNQEAMRCVSPNSLSRNSTPLSPRSRSPAATSTPTAAIRSRSRSPIASVVKPVSVEPVFRVTVGAQLTNPLVNKIANPTNVHYRKSDQQVGRNSGVHNANRASNNGAVLNRSHSVPNTEKQLFGRMAADQIEMSKGYGFERDGMKSRLGNRSGWNKNWEMKKKLENESLDEKKRVTFGVVKTKEIPALHGTQPVRRTPATGNPLLSKRHYAGSIALGTESDFFARRINLWN